ncbi:sensor histidine kinase [Methylocystis parvus]|uniref:sensor histidine kinase n=1 Tax=Methylocystis parvus TaxID=134 RepID=UPI003C70BD53
MRLWFSGFLSEHPFIPFFLAVLLVIAFAGAGPGVVATMLSAAIAAYAFMQPVGTLSIAAQEDYLRLLIFVGMGVSLSLGADWMRRRRDAELEAATARAQQAAIDALTRSENALKDADRRKDEFLATLAHELRNPLAAMRSATYALEHELPEETQEKRRALAIIDRQLNQLIRLVDDLLEVSRITTGNIALKKERVDLVDVLRSAAESAQPMIARGAHAFEIDVPAAPIILDGDSTRLAQVFTNLLNNAAKYTDPGGTIRLSAERCKDEAVVTVRDNGIGIPPEMLGDIFDFFSQVDRRDRRAQSGLGIGLGLVKKLVELHQGTVEAESGGAGSGSAFIVHLPLAEARAQR